MVTARLAAVMLSVLVLAGASLAAEPPQLEDAKLVYMHETDAAVVQATDGALLLEKDDIPVHDACRQRYQARTMPIALPIFRPGVDEPQPALPDSAVFEGIDARQRGWYCSTTATASMTWYQVASKALSSRKVDGYYSRYPVGPRPEARWPVAGHDVLVTDDAAWIVAKNRLLKVAGSLNDDPREIAFPAPADKNEAEDLLGPGNGNMPCWGHSIYRFGNELWILRSLTSNCHKPGTFALRVADDTATVMARSKEEFITGVMRHADATYLLVESRSYEGHQEVFTPKRIERLKDDKAETVDETIPTTPVARLGDKFAPAAFEGADAARLLAMDRAGRQYLQVYAGGLPTPTLLVVTNRAVVKAELPSANAVLDAPADDGRMLGHDADGVFVLEARTFAPQRLLATGNLAVKDVKVLGARKGVLCLSVNSPIDGMPSVTPLWIDPSARDTTPVLKGKRLSENLPMQANNGAHHPVAVGADGRLWFVRHWDTPNPNARGLEPQSTVETQLCRVTEAGTVSELTEKLRTSVHPSVWVLDPDTAIVATTAGNDGIAGSILWKGESAKVHASLKVLVHEEAGVLLAAMPDGAAFCSGDTDQQWLIRLGDTLYVDYNYYERVGNGAGERHGYGVYRDGKWLVDKVKPFYGDPGEEKWQPLVDRIVAWDSPSRRLLAFTSGCKTLKWLPLDEPETEKAEVLAEHTGAWAFTWHNSTPAPRVEGTWTLTPAALETFAKISDKRVEEARARGSNMPDWDARYRSADVPACRKWTGRDFRQLPTSFLGSTVYEAAGYVWLFREREVGVFDRQGREQLIALDAGDCRNARLAVESRTAVWVATRESLSRFVLETPPDNPGVWKQDKRFRLPRLGVGFAGPWIVSGRLFWTSGTSLYGTPIETLLKSQ